MSDHEGYKSENEYFNLSRKIQAEILYFLNSPGIMKLNAGHMNLLLKTGRLGTYDGGCRLVSATGHAQGPALRCPPLAPC